MSNVEPFEGVYNKMRLYNGIANLSHNQGCIMGTNI
jgi:hypothetical protein